MTFAAFVLSTGRCGTQWLATSLAGAYSDLITADHEPLRDRYEPRKALGRSASATSPSTLPTAGFEHCREIERQLDTRSDVECGHLVWSTTPDLAERFRGRVRIVHLTRHPVTTCCSWMTHAAFQPPIPEKILLSPFDEGIRFAEYQQTWATLSPFEKYLFYWCEVHAFSLDLESRLDVPWLRLRYEDLFDGDVLVRLVDFLELPHRAGIFSHRTALVDRYQFLNNVWQLWQIIDNPPRVKVIAQQLGYSLSGVEETALRRRYPASRPKGFSRWCGSMPPSIRPCHPTLIAEAVRIN